MYFEGLRNFCETFAKKEMDFFRNGILNLPCQPFKEKPFINRNAKP